LDKIKINDYLEVIEIIKAEIFNQAEDHIKLDENNNKINSLNNEKTITNLKEQAKIYNDYLEKSDKSLEEKLIHIYTMEGFLVYSINSVLRNNNIFNSHLYLYFCLLQASIVISSKKYNPGISFNSLKTLNGDEYYVFYR